MFPTTPSRSAFSFAFRWCVCIATVAAIAFISEQNATAQNRDPQAVFEYAAQQEERGVDTHFGPSVIDRAFDPFKCFDAKMAEVDGPQILGLYAPLWQTGTQTGSPTTTAWKCSGGCN